MQEPKDSHQSLDSDFSSADHSPGFMLWQVTNLWQRQMRLALTPLDLTHVQFVLLATTVDLHHRVANGTITQRLLADRAKTDEMMTSQTVRTLIGKDLITRERSELDGRAFSLSPTALGIERAKAAVAVVEAADRKFFSATKLPAKQLVEIFTELVLNGDGGES